MLRKVALVIYIGFFVLHPFGEINALNRWSDFAGTWNGEARIIVSWCEQKQLSFALHIDMDGTVSGRIGNAYIRHGEIKRNNVIYRWLGNRQYIIDAELSNYLIEKEKVKRDSIRIFLDFERPFFVGGFHTSGSKFGGKERMILSGSNLKLFRKVK